MTRLRKDQTALWLLAGGTAVVSAIAVGLGAAFARAVLRPVKRPAEPLRVLGVRRSSSTPSVTISRGEDALLEGNFSFVFNGAQGHARLGRVLRFNAASVERELIEEVRGTLLPGLGGRVTGWWFDEPHQADVTNAGVWHEIQVPGELGPMPAWQSWHDLKPGSAVAIHVHGRATERAETLRGVAPLRRAGYEHLVVSYRNDRGAPAAPSGEYGLGSTEWRDVEAAIDYAVAAGAEHVLLVGWSMGGAAVLLAAQYTRHADRLAGLVLESPGIDWPDILRHQAKRSTLPAWVATLGMRLMRKGSRLATRGGSLPVHRLTATRSAEELRVPVLQLVSLGDTFVPPTGALQLARLRADLVRTEQFATAEHVKLWNEEPERWEDAVEAFGRERLGARLGETNPQGDAV